jgi:nucleotide-binding universal stress UspA family protein
MSEILVPIDGAGPRTQRALAEAIRIHRAERVPVCLLNVQLPVSGHVAAFFGSRELEKLQRETGFDELAPAKALLDAAGVPCRAVVKVGRRAETIARTARDLGCDRIVMGDVPQGGVESWFGSVGQQVRQQLQALDAARLVTVI